MSELGIYFRRGIIIIEGNTSKNIKDLEKIILLNDPSKCYQLEIPGKELHFFKCFIFAQPTLYRTGERQNK